MASPSLVQIVELDFVLLPMVLFGFLLEQGQIPQWSFLFVPAVVDTTFLITMEAV
jgi:hypothetical protein